MGLGNGSSDRPVLRQFCCTESSRVLWFSFFNLESLTDCIGLLGIDTGFLGSAGSMFVPWRLHPNGP